MPKAEDLKSTIDRLNAELTRIESVPDPALMPVETVVFWEKVYPGGPRRLYMTEPESTAYKFVAIKVAPNTWYTTSIRDGAIVENDDTLRDALAGPNISNRYIVSEWLKLDEYVPTSPFEGPGE